MTRFPITLAIGLATLAAGTALAMDNRVLVRIDSGASAPVSRTTSGLAGPAQSNRITVRTEAIRNDNHWLLRGTRNLRRERVVNPLAGPPRTRYGKRRVVYDPPKAGAFGQTGTLRVAGTIVPRRPRAQVIKVDGTMVDIAEERAIRRLEKFEREDIEIRFHSPSEAYDARYPSVVYLDSQ